MTTLCSGSIPEPDMLDYAGLSVVFAIMTIGIPHTISSLVGGSIGLALAHPPSCVETKFFRRSYP